MSDEPTVIYLPGVQIVVLGDDGVTTFNTGPRKITHLPRRKPVDWDAMIAEYLARDPEGASGWRVTESPEGVRVEPVFPESGGAG